jgi:hypothetical protein
VRFSLDFLDLCAEPLDKDNRPRVLDLMVALLEDHIGAGAPYRIDVSRHLEALVTKQVTLLPDLAALLHVIALLPLIASSTITLTVVGYE